MHRLPNAVTDQCSDDTKAVGLGTDLNGMRDVADSAANLDLLNGLE